MNIFKKINDKRKRILATRRVNKEKREKKALEKIIFDSISKRIEEEERKKRLYNEWVDTPNGVWPGQYQYTKRNTEDVINTAHIRLSEDSFERYGIMKGGKFFGLLEGTNFEEDMDNKTERAYNEKFKNVVKTLDDLANAVKGEPYENAFMVFEENKYSLEIDGQNIESSRKEAFELISKAKEYFSKAKRMRLGKVLDEEYGITKTYVSIGYQEVVN